MMLSEFAMKEHYTMRVVYRRTKWRVWCSILMADGKGRRSIELELMAPDGRRVALRFAKDHELPIREGYAMLDNVPQSKEPPRWVV